MAHKLFAKTSFLGKKVIFLPECHSTSQELSTLAQNVPESNGMVVYTDHQVSGKGQRGNSWVDRPGQNLLTSILLKPDFLSVNSAYYLYMISGLAVLGALQDSMPTSYDLKIKWPNDVMVGNKKIAGILIENSLKGNKLDTSIIGVGININQSQFDELNATSLLLELGRITSREMIHEKLLLRLEYWFEKMKNEDYGLICETYLAALFWKEENRAFLVDGKIIKGVIKGVSKSGKLKLQTSVGIRHFDAKEIKFLIPKED